MSNFEHKVNMGDDGGCECTTNAAGTGGVTCKACIAREVALAEGAPTMMEAYGLPLLVVQNWMKQLPPFKGRDAHLQLVASVIDALEHVEEPTYSDTESDIESDTESEIESSDVSEYD